jgi:methylated-DNA-[protein]-cysteine S-methyltransferase
MVAAMPTLHAAVLPAPFGDLVVAVDDQDQVVALVFRHEASAEDALRGVVQPGETVAWDDGRCAALADQLGAYFRRERTAFDLTVAPRGTPFEQRVWAALGDIPYGSATSYGELARRLGDPGAVRAVGRANGANPISIVIPCHRVIGADGALVGYGGGLEVKRWLLELEGVLLPGLGA